ncbi:MAG: pitrilysin family protein [Desulfobacteraceae bacterium]|jgi:predicted Zn-dependent peptidase
MYRKTVLDNGVRIVSERLDHFRSVSLGIWVSAGSRDEMVDENGISHFIEHMIFKGTRTRNSLQIAKDLDAVGGLSNAFTGTEHTCFHSKVLDKHLLLLADILSDIFLNSIFDSHEMQRERQVILQEISLLEDTPDEHIHVLLNRLFWMNHPLGMPILGTPDTVSAIRKESILDYIERFYTPERILVAAAGNVDHDALVGHFGPLLERLQPTHDDPPRNAPQGHAGVSCHYKDLEQVHVCLGGKGPHMSSDLRYAAGVLNTILGGNMSSRLFQEIREKRGLAYSVYSFISAYVDAGLSGVCLGTDPRQINRALKVIQREIKKIQKGGISKSDLAATQEHLIGGILLNAENTDTRMIRLAKNEYVFGRYISYEELVADLEKVTVDEVVAVARNAFESDQISLVTLGPVRKEDLDLSCIQFSDR